MLLLKERELIVEYGRKLINSNLTNGTSGNLSIYNREKDLICISPSGMDYFKTSPKDIVIMDIAGNRIDGDKNPSSEFELHRIFYAGRKDIDAVIHTHSRFATTLACLNWSLPPIHYMLAIAGGHIRCTEYASFGTDELAKNAFIGMENRNAVLLANHGLLAGSYDLKNAFNIIEQVEYTAELYYRSKVIGEPIIISDKEMDLMSEKFKSYGQIEGD